MALDRNIEPPQQAKNGLQADDLQLLDKVRAKVLESLDNSANEICDQVNRGINTGDLDGELRQTAQPGEPSPDDALEIAKWNLGKVHNGREHAADDRADLL